ncbi:MAG: DHHW family protein [Dorea sp.]|nr:DHHW family protein [Dorea sp.]
MARKKMSLKQKKTMTKFRALGSRLFIVLLLVFALLGLLIPIRPKESQVEKRTLTKWPEFSVASFLNGEYFEGISTWYSDTFPLRDVLISANQSMASLYGFNSGEQMLGSEVQADEIPTEMEEKTPEQIAAEKKAEEERKAAEGTQSQVGKGQATLPDAYAMEEAVQANIQQTLYVKDGAAYTVYGFDKDGADIYINALNDIAAKLKGKTNVYSMLVPTNAGVVLDQDLLKSLGGSDQQQTIDYYYNSYKDVTPIETIRILREHNKEYLYFRTDHHWTADAAYYGYTNFCVAKGWTPHKRESFQTVEFPGFLGTYYTKLDCPADMAANPDTVKAYIPNDTNDMVFTDVAGQEIPWNVIYDVSDRDEGAYYGCFVAGDQPISVIENPKITDGSSCVVLKESYGNSFIPFLVDHYQKIVIIDFRYTTVNVAQYVVENNIKDLIVVNNIGIINSTDVAQTIANELYYDGPVAATSTEQTNTEQTNTEQTDNEQTSNE